MSNYMNEAGEPYMTAAQLNFEAALDEQSAYERQFDYDQYDDDDCGDCERSDCDWCIDNGLAEPEDDYEVAEDAAMEAGLFGWDA
jgi:hypothetical protein